MEGLVRQGRKIAEGRVRAQAGWSSGHLIKVRHEVVLSHLVNVSITLRTGRPSGT